MDPAEGRGGAFPGGDGPENGGAGATLPGGSRAQLPRFQVDFEEVLEKVLWFRKVFEGGFETILKGF